MPAVVVIIALLVGAVVGGVAARGRRRAGWSEPDRRSASQEADIAAGWRNSVGGPGP